MCRTNALSNYRVRENDCCRPYTCREKSHCLHFFSGLIQSYNRSNKAQGQLQAEKISAKKTGLVSVLDNSWRMVKSKKGEMWQCIRRLHMGVQLIIRSTAGERNAAFHVHLPFSLPSGTSQTPEQQARCPTSGRQEQALPGASHRLAALAPSRLQPNRRKTTIHHAERTIQLKCMTDTY